MQETQSPVLVVDDEENVAKITRIMLERAGFPVAVAGSAQEAYDKIEGNELEFGAAVIDMSLPGASGLDVAQRFRSHYPDAPILFTSGDFEDTWREQFAQLTPSAFIQKPFGSDALLAKLRGFAE